MAGGGWKAGWPRSPGAAKKGLGQVKLHFGGSIPRHLSRNLITTPSGLGTRTGTRA